MAIDVDAMEQDADERLNALFADDETVGDAGDTGTESTHPEMDAEANPGENEQGTETDDRDADADVREDGDVSGHDARVPMSQYESALKRMHEATQEAAELRRMVQSLNDRLLALSQDRERSVPEPEGKSESDTDETEFEADFPEIARYIKKNLGQIKAELEPVKKTAAQLARERVERENRQHVETILSAHPDANDLAKSEQFTRWLEQSPPAIQRIAMDGEAPDVIYLLNLYKKDTGLVNDAADAARQTEIPGKTVEQARQVASPKVMSKPSQPQAKPAFTREQLANIPLDQWESLESQVDDYLRSIL